MLYQDLWYLAFALALVPSALLLRLISLPAIRPCPVAVEVHPSSVPGGRSRSTTQPWRARFGALIRCWRCASGRVGGLMAARWWTAGRRGPSALTSALHKTPHDRRTMPWSGRFRTCRLVAAGAILPVRAPATWGARKAPSFANVPNFANVQDWAGLWSLNEGAGRCPPTLSRASQGRNSERSPGRTWWRTSS